MNTISILGSGWLGLPLAQFFKQNGYNVKASTTSPNRLTELTITGLEAFLVDTENLCNTIDHFLDSEILIINITSKNTEAFQQLITKIQKSPITKVIFISSTSVYKSNNKVVSESDLSELNENNPLLTIEKLFQSCIDFETTVIRFGGLIGYSRNPGRFFAGGKTVRDPNGRVNLIHRDDCIGMIGAIIEKQAWGELFNGCSDTHPTKREFYTKAALESRNPVPQFDDSTSIPFKIISNEKAKAVLNYQFVYPDLMKIDFS
jgi:nucleoside-diphosphate-sugar epimerase